MKVSKAIELLKHKVAQNVFQVDPDALTALKLGIEALKAIEEDEYRGTEVPRPPLPGETPEEEVGHD